MAVCTGPASWALHRPRRGEWRVYVSIYIGRDRGLGQLPRDIESHIFFVLKLQLYAFLVRKPQPNIEVRVRVRVERLD